MVIGGTRVHYRRQNTYNTKSNKVKIVRTPGSRLKVQYVGKRSKGPMTPASLGHKPIPGIKHLLTMDRKRARHRHLTVSRAYGGCLTHDLVRERIIRAFLIEEQKIVKRVLKAQGKKKRGKKRR
uniref:60S ribosomal protein L34 n=1 Tax=Eutreptiella gymnastica TaxID=73025 RepID=A0A7S4FXQ0_9EUGL|mmetsp:Transcript_79607/g.133347  ORF Transcript_79607/g.133347 Transcript_79607/m.133347 type:complete len:124 (+) Transcript_79607:66-437(+)|eukprot:CAMPEP_0174290942 /NCGR_PEP_ID=MMETSP0809-20121228/30579_1 /TAXON_ID=73025 ORGANISM="Eutreptiella gymnastica-like, Strain CCMP1594" /NCGR_SAMPLE_ID=MMETSP0809 /ASSEMBLY_ACC=CAM_ASM_000658 /LENGTH=123 /DNA_ID=CAMNT_0015389963 /DNA_START=59 /DNA_END=430 /DNA_ORIENTATION=+